MKSPSPPQLQAQGPEIPWPCSCWLNARLAVPDKDHRPESRRIDADSIERPGRILETKDGDWITDWEIGALFWKCLQAYGPAGWEAKFRLRLETEFAKKDLLLLMGTIHRFPDQWLIVGIVYPPKLPSGAGQQLGFSLGL